MKALTGPIGSVYGERGFPWTILGKLLRQSHGNGADRDILAYRCKYDDRCLFRADRGLFW